MKKMRYLVLWGIVFGLVFAGCENKGLSAASADNEGGVMDSVCDTIDEECLDLDSLDNPCEGYSKETTMDELFPDGLLDVELYMTENYPELDSPQDVNRRKIAQQRWKWHEEVKKKMNQFLKSKQSKGAPYDTMDEQGVLKMIEDGFDLLSCCGSMTDAAQGMAMVAHYQMIDSYKDLLSNTQNQNLHQIYFDDYIYWEDIAMQWMNDWKDEALKDQSYYTMFPLECYGILMAVREWRISFLQEEKACLQGKKKWDDDVKDSVSTNKTNEAFKEWYAYRKRTASKLDGNTVKWFNVMTQRISKNYTKANFFPEYD